MAERAAGVEGKMQEKGNPNPLTASGRSINERQRRSAQFSALGASLIVTVSAIQGDYFVPVTFGV
jgi:hypothetical protein